VSKIAISGAATGTATFTIESPATSTNRTLTLPDNTGTIITTGSTFAGTGPAFSAYLSTNQTVTNNVFTKLQANTEEFDTASCYDNATNYRFTPNIAGYYQINGNVFLSASTTLNSSAGCFIYKNDSRFKDGTLSVSANTGASLFSVVSALVYLNGSTDYVELYGIATGTGTLAFAANTPTVCYFQGFLARAA
jgi:hypothetical protein